MGWTFSFIDRGGELVVVKAIVVTDEKERINCYRMELEKYQKVKEVRCI